MSIKLRIFVLMGICFGGFLIFFTQAWRPVSQMQSEAGHLRNAVDLSVHLGNLVHEIQKERGMTAGFLGSKGNKFAEEIIQQRKLVDEKYSTLKKFLDGGKRSHYSTDIQNTLANVEKDLKGVSKVREQVNQLEIPVSVAVPFYTNLNTQLLGITADCATIPGQSKLALQMRSFTEFMQGKERAGIERAVLANTFAQDKFGPGFFKKFVSLVAQQNAFMGDFLVLATPEMKTQFEAAQKGEAFTKVEEFRQIASDKATVGGFGQDAQEWFAASTSRINILHKIELDIADSLSRAAVNQKVIAGRAQMWLFGIFAGVVGVAGVLSWQFYRSVAIPVVDVTNFANTLASGDLSNSCDVKASGEVGELVIAMNKMRDNLSRMVENVTGNALTLTESSTRLSSTADRLAQGAEDTSNQSNMVSAAAEEMSINMNTVASSTEEMSANVRTVTTAIEEMTSCIGEVAQNAEKAAMVADEAARLTETNTERVEQLGNAADEIGQVIQDIRDIAEQTNLLALNATIEAARAGDAGKGFAVVANEVKELAKQTGEATDNITARVQAIQESSGNVVDAMGEMDAVIKNVNEVSRTIASAVEEQRVTTAEISHSLTEANTVVESVSQGITESATASREITEQMVKVDQSTRETSTGASDTQDAGTELLSLAQELQLLVSEFKVESKADDDAINSEVIEEDVLNEGLVVSE